MGSFHDPAACRLAGLALTRDLRAAGAQMQGEPEGLGEVAGLLIVMALIQAEMLGTLVAGLGPGDGDRLQRLAHHGVVVAVGAGHDDGERRAARVGEQAALGPALGPVRWGGTGFFPHRGAPCPSPRPAPATPSRSPPAHRRPEALPARMLRTHRPRSILENGDGRRRTSRSRWRSAHSTGSRCAARRRSRPWMRGRACAVYGSLADAKVAPAAAAPSAPKARLRDGSRRP